MPSQLRDEIKQSRPFVSVHEEAYLNLARTAAVLSHSFAEALKPYGITATQYNVLRILRGAGEAGASCGEISERLVTKDSDITRLLDRLEARGLISRGREAKDRRRITARITEEGLRILAELDRPVAQCHRRQLSHLGEKRLAALSKLLDAARDRPE